MMANEDDFRFKIVVSGRLAIIGSLLPENRQELRDDLNSSENSDKTLKLLLDRGIDNFQFDHRDFPLEQETAKSPKEICEEIRNISSLVYFQERELLYRANEQQNPKLIITDTSSSNCFNRQHYSLNAIIYEKSDYYIYATRKGNEWMLSSISGNYLHDWNALYKHTKELGAFQYLLVFTLNKTIDMNEECKRMNIEINKTTSNSPFKNLIHMPNQIDLKNTLGLSRNNSENMMKKPIDFHDNEGSSATLPSLIPSHSTKQPILWTCTECGFSGNSGDVCQQCTSKYKQQLNFESDFPERNITDIPEIDYRASIRMENDYMNLSGVLEWKCEFCKTVNISFTYICKKCSKTNDAQYDILNKQS